MNKFLELKMLNEVKLKYPQFDWLDEPTEVQYDEDDFLMDTDSLFELEKSVKNRSLIYQQVPGNTIIYDLSVAPEVEYSFESEEEAFVQVYTDKDGNIRSMYLNID